MARANKRTDSDGPRGIAPGTKIEIEILRGKAANRFRPVTVPVFLIGSASDCDLVLGDRAFPEVHTYLYVAGNAVTLRHLGFEPSLSVQGALVENARLEHGQCFRLGPKYEFRIHIRSEDDGTRNRSYRIDPSHGRVPAPQGDHAPQGDKVRERIFALLEDVRRELNFANNPRFSQPSALTTRQLLLYRPAKELRESA